MSLPARQYAAMRGALRGALSANDPFAANPSDGEVLGFFAQLFSAASGATIPAAELPAVSVAAARLLTSNEPAAANPTDADVVTFWGQLNTDASGAAQLSARRYLALRAALRGALSANYPGVSNPSEADMLGYFGAFAIGTAPIVAQITQASGCQLAIDTDYCPGAVNGSPVTSIANRSGSNAVFDSVNNWGHGASVLPTWRSAGWGKTQSALSFLDNGMRFTGSDVTGCITGVGKAWHAMFVYQPMFLSRTTGIVGGWGNSAGGQFANGMLQWTTTVGTAGSVPQMFWQGQAAANVADGVRYRWEPLVFEMARPDATHVRSTFNGQVSTPIAYGSGTNFAADGFYFGAWPSTAAGVNDGIASDMLLRACFVWDHLLTGPEVTTMYNYIRTYYKGFDFQAALGAT